jgi:hypothetical protein
MSVFALGAMLWLPAHAQSHHRIGWERSYGGARYHCRVESAVVAADGDLWCICDGTDYSTTRRVTNIYRIDGRTGDLRFARELRTRLPYRPFAWESLHHLVTSGAAVSILTNLVSGGKDQVFEGVFLTPLDSNGAPGAAVQVVSKGSQLQGALQTSDGNLLVTADQSPLSIRKITRAGLLLWRRDLPSAIVLPAIAVFPDNSACVSGQVVAGEELHPKLHLTRISSAGRVTKQTTIAAAQGVVAAGPEGSCAVLYSPSFDYSGPRRLALFDTPLSRRWDTLLPFVGQDGRDYMLYTIPDGWLATVLTGGGDKRQQAVAKVSQTGKLVWSEVLAEGFEQLAVGAAGSYLITIDRNTHDAAFHVAQIHFQ